MKIVTYEKTKKRTKLEVSWVAVPAVIILMNAESIKLFLTAINAAK